MEIDVVIDARAEAAKKRVAVASFWERVWADARARALPTVRGVAMLSEPHLRFCRIDIHAGRAYTRGLRAHASIW